MKRKRSLSKKGLVGLTRVGEFPNRKWWYDGQEFDTLRMVVSYNITKTFKEQMRALAQKNVKVDEN